MLQSYAIYVAIKNPKKIKPYQTKLLGFSKSHNRILLVIVFDSVNKNSITNRRLEQARDLLTYVDRLCLQCLESRYSLSLYKKLELFSAMQFIMTFRNSPSGNIKKTNMSVLCDDSKYWSEANHVCCNKSFPDNELDWWKTGKAWIGENKFQLLYPCFNLTQRVHSNELY